jgi:hypothetical protein
MDKDDIMQLPIKEVKRLTDKVFLYEDRDPIGKRLKEKYRAEVANQSRGGLADGFNNVDGFIAVNDNYKYEWLYDSDEDEVFKCDWPEMKEKIAKKREDENWTQHKQIPIFDEGNYVFPEICLRRQFGEGCCCGVCIGLWKATNAPPAAAAAADQTPDRPRRGPNIWPGAAAAASSNEGFGFVQDRTPNLGCTESLDLGDGFTQTDDLIRNLGEAQDNAAAAAAAEDNEDNNSQSRHPTRLSPQAESPPDRVRTPSSGSNSNTED